MADLRGPHARAREVAAAFLASLSGLFQNFRPTSLSISPAVTTDGSHLFPPRGRMLREILQVLRSDYAFALITASLAVLLAVIAFELVGYLGLAMVGLLTLLVCAISVAADSARGKSFHGLTRAARFSAAAASAKNIKAIAAAVPRATSKPLQRHSSRPPPHSLDGLEAEVIDSQEHSRDDADAIRH